MSSVARNAALFTLFAASAAAQPAWDSIPAGSKPVHMEGALVVHDNGSDIFAFSATARRFHKLGSTGAEIHTGDWTALLRTQDQVTMYSARLNNHVTATGVDPLFVKCEDDVAIYVTPGQFGGLYAIAYSAVTGTADAIPYTPTSAGMNVDIASSRFVIVLRMANSVWGFSARFATWIELPNVAADKPFADGNVGLVDIPNGFSGNTAAFSGVLGSWATSPDTHHTNSSVARHNVAYVRADSTSSLYKACAYSAYNGTWVTSSTARPLNFTNLHLRDNVIALEGTDVLVPGLEAFGARPGLAWVTYDPFVSVSSLNQDYVISNDLANKRVVSFSGLCDGTFDVMSFMNPGGFGAVHGAHCSFGIDQAPLPQDTVHYGYSPHTNTWAVNPVKFVYSWSAEDAVIDCIGPIANPDFWAYSARAGQWIQGPPYIGSALHVIERTGSVIAHQSTAGPGAGEILMFDERASAWPAPYQPGFTSDMTAGRNLLMLRLHDTARTVIGFSMQRGDWQQSPGVDGPPLIDPVAEENVAYFVDNEGNLCAFASHSDVHAYYQWPNGTEYQTTGVEGTAIPGSMSGTSWTGDFGESIYLLTALDASFPGVNVFGWQNPVCLDLGTLSVFGPFATVGTSGVVGISGPLPQVAAPVCFDFWVQGAFAGGPQGNRFSVRCDPRWVF